MDDVEDGDFIVIDQSGVDVGLMGSANGMGGFGRGIRGYVTNGGVRDTDELILQKIPFWSRLVSQGMDQGRIQYDAKDVPVAVGGVTVRPGDIVVADGDGVVVVPRRLARVVAQYAWQELKGDKAVRRRMYEEQKREPDNTVF
jgi:regulator of RNase E activity RraA